MLSTRKYAGPWLGPIGSRPVGHGTRPMAPGQIQPGVFLAVKTRVSVAESMVGTRIRSPVECCRVRADVPLPQEFAELTIIPVEFLLADRCATVKGRVRDKRAGAGWNREA